MAKYNPVLVYVYPPALSYVLGEALSQFGQFGDVLDILRTAKKRMGLPLDKNWVGIAVPDKKIVIIKWAADSHNIYNASPYFYYDFTVDEMFRYFDPNTPLGGGGGYLVGQTIGPRTTLGNFTLSEDLDSRALDIETYEGPLSDVDLSLELDYMRKVIRPGYLFDTTTFRPGIQIGTNYGYGANIHTSLEWFNTYVAAGTKYDRYSFIAGAFNQLAIKQLCFIDATRVKCFGLDDKPEHDAHQRYEDNFSVANTATTDAQIIPESWLIDRFRDLFKPIAEQSWFRQLYYQEMYVVSTDDNEFNRQYSLTGVVNNINGMYFDIPGETVIRYYRTPLAGYLTGRGYFKNHTVIGTQPLRDIADSESFYHFFFQVYEDNSLFDEDGALITLDLEGHIILSGTGLLTYDNPVFVEVDRPAEGPDPDGDNYVQQNVDDTLTPFYVHYEINNVPVPGSVAPPPANNTFIVYNPDPLSTGLPQYYQEYARPFVGDAVQLNSSGSWVPAGRDLDPEYSNSIAYNRVRPYTDGLVSDGGPATYSFSTTKTSNVNGEFDISFTLDVSQDLIQVGTNGFNNPLVGELLTRFGSYTNVAYECDIPFDENKHYFTFHVERGGFGPISQFTGTFPTQPKYLHQSANVYFIYHTIFGDTWISYHYAAFNENNVELPIEPVSFFDVGDYDGAYRMTISSYFTPQYVNSISAMLGASEVGTHTTVSKSQFNITHEQYGTTTIGEVDYILPYWDDLWTTSGGKGSILDLHTPENITLLFGGDTFDVDESNIDYVTADLTFVDQTSWAETTFNGGSLPRFPYQVSIDHMQDATQANAYALLAEHGMDWSENFSVYALATYQVIKPPTAATCRHIPSSVEPGREFFSGRYGDSDDYDENIYRSAFLVYFVDSLFNKIATITWSRGITNATITSQGLFTNGYDDSFMDVYDRLKNVSYAGKTTELTTEQRGDLILLKSYRTEFDTNVTVIGNDICTYGMLAAIEASSLKSVNYIMISDDIVSAIQSQT